MGKYNAVSVIGFMVDLVLNSFSSLELSAPPSSSGGYPAPPPPGCTLFPHSNGSACGWGGGGEEGHSHLLLIS